MCAPPILRGEAPPGRAQGCRETLLEMWQQQDAAQTPLQAAPLQAQHSKAPTVFLHCLSGLSPIHPDLCSLPSVSL